MHKTLTSISFEYPAGQCRHHSQVPTSQRQPPQQVLHSRISALQAKAKIMVVRDVERDDIEYISKTLGCLPIAHPDHMKKEKLGSAALVEEVQVGSRLMSSRAACTWWLVPSDKRFLASLPRGPVFGLGLGGFLGWWRMPGMVCENLAVLQRVVLSCKPRSCAVQPW